jgi:hypothetical protein
MNGNGKVFDRIYYNATLKNVESLNEFSIPSEYKDTRINAVLKRPKDYYLTIERFSFDGYNIPIAIAEIQTGQSNPDLTIYSFTLRYNNASDYQTFVIYVPNDIAISKPSPPTTARANSKYYFIYYYQDFLDMCNTALSTAFTNLKTANPGATQTEAPFFIYDFDTGLISLIVPYNYLAGDPIEIWMNGPTYRFFDGIPNQYNQLGNPNGKDYKFIIKYRLNNAWAKPGGSIPTPPTNPDYLELKQEYFLSGWDPLDNLLFQTAEIPVLSENVYSNTDAFGAKSYKNIITDFKPIFDKRGSVRSVYEYFPTGPYRLINLKSDTELKVIDFTVTWLDKTGVEWDLSLFLNEGLSIKFLFILKSSYIPSFNHNGKY